MWEMASRSELFFLLLPEGADDESSELAVRGEIQLLLCLSVSEDADADGSEEFAGFLNKCCVRDAGRSAAAAAAAVAIDPSDPLGEEAAKGKDVVGTGEDDSILGDRVRVGDSKCVLDKCCFSAEMTSLASAADWARKMWRQVERRCER